MKTSRIDYHSSCLISLRILRLDQITLDEAEVIKEHHTVQVVHLVAECTREQVFAFEDNLPTVQIEPPEDDFPGASDPFTEAGDAQATFLLVLLALGVDDLGVDDDKQIVRFLATARVGNHDPSRRGHLGSGQAHSGGLVHRLDHVPYKIDFCLCDVLDRFGDLP